jgi:hypothetical protein
MALFILYRVEQAGHSMMVDTFVNLYRPGDTMSTARSDVPSSPNSIDTGESFLHKDWRLGLLIIRSFSVSGMGRDQI